MIGTETARERKLRSKLRNARRPVDRITILEDQVARLSEQLASLERTLVSVETLWPLRHYP